jgi:hypothetical protein
MAEGNILSRLSEMCALGSLHVPHNLELLERLIPVKDITEQLRIKQLSFANVQLCNSRLDRTSEKDKVSLLDRDFCGEVIKQGVCIALTGESLISGKVTPIQFLESVSTEIVDALVDAVLFQNKMGKYQKGAVATVVGKSEGPNAPNVS